MAKLYGDIASSVLMTLDKSFAPANGQPVDSREVYYSIEDAIKYAASNGAYIGQKIVVVENNKVTHYSIEDAIGTLKELGSKPTVDGLTIEALADGKLSLANVPKVEKDAEGNDIPATYNAVLVNGKLSWVKPSTTTVEGLVTITETLSGRVDTTEQAIARLNGDANTEGSILSMIEKSISNVDIKIATKEEAGIVKAQEAENGVTVDETGAMNVYSLNVNKLVQTEGDSLVLNGGNANI